MRRKRGEAAAPVVPSRRTDAATRVRLMALDTGHGTVELDGASVCVLAPGREGRNVAATIAHAVIGPRAADIDGYVEIAGQPIDLASLPTPLLRPSAPRTIDDGMLREIWQAICAPRRARVAKAHAARRLERHRTIAEIERAHERVVPAPRPRRVEQPVLPAAPRVQQDDDVRDVQLLMDAVDRLVPVPSPEALRVASELEYLLANPPAEPGVDLGDLETREAELAAARATVADIAGVVPPAVRQRIAQCHYDVTEAEAALFTSSRRSRDVALARYQQALTREREALAEAGVDSYVAFLVAIVAGVGAAKPAEVDLQVRLRAELELAQAEAAVEDARKQIGVMPPSEHAARMYGLEAQATELLGRAPGHDPVAELCALRVAHPDAGDLREQLEQRLAGLGVEDSDDVMGAAESFVRERRAAPVADGPAIGADTEESSEVSSVDDEHALDVALATLLEQREEHDAALAAMEAELEMLDTQRARPIAQLAPAGVTLVIATLLEHYRDGQLLAGRLPLVIDRAFDAFDASRTAAAAELLAKAKDVQVVVVTQQPAVVEAFGAMGTRDVQWPQPEVAANEPEPIEEELAAPSEAVVNALWIEDAGPAGEPEPIVAMCVEHPRKVSAAACAQCERGCCIECLVYVPGEAALWCTACVHSVRPNDLRAANS